MKLIHLSDLHLGKSLHMVSLKEAQQDILEQILQKIRRICPDAVLIAGDLYDRHIPPESAVEALDDFLYSLTQFKTRDGGPLQVMLISGNHDSAERLAFGGRIMEKGGIHVSPVWQAGSVSPIILEDAYGPVCFYLLPYISRFEAKAAFPEQTINTYTQAVQAAIEDMHVDPAVRNVLVAHQFVTDAVVSGSEDIVGGLDNVDACVFDDFDYVALGHLHRPQWVKRETIRYCGSPLKYAAAEADQPKSLTIVELGKKGEVSITTEPLRPKHDLARVRGDFNTLIRPDDHPDLKAHREDYLELTLTDEQPPAGVLAQLREVYPRLVNLRIDNTATREAEKTRFHEIGRRRPALELLEEFYGQRHAKKDGVTARLSEEQRSYAEKILSELAQERLTEGGTNP